MIKLLPGIRSLIFVAIFSSCNNADKTSESQSVANTSNAQITMPVTDTLPDRPAEQPQKPVRTGITGRQIVENISFKLSDKLNLSEEQEKSLSSILSKRFVETGGDLDATYPVEMGKKMGRDLRLKSASLISAVLNPVQREHFEKFMNK